MRGPWSLVGLWCVVALAVACSASADPVASTVPSELPPWMQDVGPAPSTDDPFAWSASAEPVLVGGSADVTLRLVVPPGTHVYRDAVSAVLVHEEGLPDDGLTARPLELPPGEEVPDPAGSGATRAQFAHDTVLHLSIDASEAATLGLRTLLIDVRHQGCRVGLCFPLKTTRLEVLMPVRSGAAG